MEYEICRMSTENINMQVSIIIYLRVTAPYSANMTARFSIGEVDKPTQHEIVKGFQRYTRAAISPQGKIPERENKKERDHTSELHQKGYQ